MLDTNRDADAEDGSLVSGRAANPLWSSAPTYAGTTDTAEDAFDRVLDYVGNLTDWQTNFGHTSPSAIAAVPEPASLAVVALLFTVTAAARLRR